MILRLLTELDALLDTRVGLIDTLNGEWAAALIDNPAYYTRVQDKFEALCGVPQALYEAAWDARDARILPHSLVTVASDLVNYGLLQIEHQAIQDPEIHGAALDVNLWPYVLSEAEQQALLVALAQCLGYRAPIALLCEPWSAFTPERVRSTYAGMILYNHNDWFKAQAERLNVQGIPQVTLVAPALAYRGIPTDEALTFEFKGKINPYEATEYAMVEKIGLEYVDVSNYCIAIPQIKHM